MNTGWKALLIAAVCVISFFGGLRYEGARKDAEIAQIRAEQAQERTQQALAEKDAVDRARLEEQRRTRAQMEIANDAKKQADAARADARAADIAAERLRQRVATLLRERDASNSAPASGGASPEPAGVVLANMFRWIDERAGELAEKVDATSIAGRACKASYDALTP